MNNKELVVELVVMYQTNPSDAIETALHEALTPVVNVFALRALGDKDTFRTNCMFNLFKVLRYKYRHTYGIVPYINKCCWLQLVKHNTHNKNYWRKQHAPLDSIREPEVHTADCCLEEEYEE